MNNYKILLALTVALATSSLLSCQKTQTDELQNAQLCLNKAAPSAAKACVTNIASNTTAYASSLRCAAIFISEGYNTPSSFLNAIDSINQAGNCGGGCSSTVNALNSFRFISSGVTTAPQRTANNETAAEAFVQCSASGVKFYTQLGSLFKIGTLTGMLAYATTGGTTPTQDQIKTELANLPAATVGDIVIGTYSTVCSDLTGASDATKAYCADLKKAIEAPTATPTGIGACLKAKLANPAAVCT
jgi:hypothetical protein